MKSYFVEKILSGIYPINQTIFPACFKKELVRYGFMMKVKPKLHTIRADPKNRWRAGRLIHLAINTRSPGYFQFAPVMPVVSVQKIKFDWTEADLTPIKKRYLSVFILKRGYAHPAYPDTWHKYVWTRLTDEVVKELARNDGFNSVDDFFKYFNEDFTGSIIHWTDKTY